MRLWDVAGYMREGVAFEIALCKAMCQSLAVEFTKAELAHFFSIIIWMDLMSVEIIDVQ